MAQLRQDHEAFIKQDSVVIAVGPDNQKSFELYWKRNNMPFIGLADPDHRAAREYDQEVTLLKFGRIPAQMLIDKNGTYRYVHYSRSMSDIPSNQDILKRLAEINT